MTQPTNPLNKDLFMRTLITHNAYVCENLLGSDIFENYILNIGLSMGTEIENAYKSELGVQGLFDLDQYLHVITDLKNRIGGNFSVTERHPDHVVVETSRCPFGDIVQKSPSLCKMTSSVFGGIAARSFGYARVVLEKRIALGDGKCRILISTNKDGSGGDEYYPDLANASEKIHEQIKLSQHLKSLAEIVQEKTAEIEERKQALERVNAELLREHAALEETKEYLQNVLEHSADMIVTTNLDGLVVEFNRSAERCLGYSREEIVGKPAEILYARRAERAELIRAVTQRGTVSNHKTELRTKDGRKVPVCLSISQLRDSSGAVIGAVGIAKDITQELALEQQLIQSEKLAAVGKLAAGIAHELNNPLGNILMYTQLALKGSADSENGGDPSELLQVIQEQTGVAKEVVQRLLNFSRGSGAAPGPLRVQGLLEQILSVMRPVLEADRIRVVYEATPGLPLIRGHAEGLRQVIVNIIDNARDAMVGGGELRITVRLAGDDGWVEMRLQDTGCGISPEHLSKIFDPFFTTKEVGRGTGLGLSVSYGIVRNHGGKIQVESLPGVGSTFTVLLPALSLSEGSPVALPHSGERRARP